VRWPAVNSWVDRPAYEAHVFDYKEAPMPRVKHVEVFKGKGAQPWRFRIVGANGRTTGQSEGYVSRANAVREAKKLGLPVVTEAK